MKNPKLVIGIVAIVVLLIIFFIIYKNSKKVVVTKSGTTVTQASLLDTLSNLFSPKPKTGTDSSTTSGGNALCKIFPKLCAPKKYCDCKKPGFASDGAADSLCNSGSMQFESDCA